ncbi:gns1 sur4 family protein [Ophiostoma piceae UAMH 11346]|uniref:Elongation of fatty acids protein n=1 Tax=Ophiostoma piceae (strain UAMH 11346) TaxID=1262450 RepID=S3CB87_OPHP1|nr:gns1 sur4 family protein [Ophiostoma piceae UAMH 11346]
MGLIADLPESSLFRFPPNADPAPFPPPQPGSAAYNSLFTIPDSLFESALDIRVPVTIAVVYAISAKLLNVYNKSTNNRPWAISKTRAFFWFVVLHNVFLAVYSAWTWIGMVGTLYRTLANPLTAPGGWSATVDSICRLNGAPGLGNGLHYDESSDLWLSQSSPLSSQYAITPERTQPGRMWNEGLAFYGWLFYISKFYEVLDTLIILAKGKFSSTLQTYHHAGAMMCMWAGMRYMSAPIWMFVFMNSGIHALMYSYYTFTAFSIRVPTKVKRSLTSAQITQFLVGASVAMVHSFVYYTVPASTAVPAAAASSGSAGASGSVLGSIKNLVSGGAVDAALANSTASGNQAASLTKTVPCIATTSETFAIWLNVLYLAPLTYLFVKFFITSYLRRSNAETARASRLGKGAVDGVSEAKGRNSTTGNSAATLAATIAETESEVRRRLSNVGNIAEKAGWDAARSLEQEVYRSSGEAIESDSPETAVPATTTKAKKSKGRSSKVAK